MQQAESSKSFVCEKFEDCSEGFQSEVELEIHIRSHHFGQIFLFDKYNKDLPTVTDLIEHLWKYFSKPKPEVHLCDDCKIEFSKLRYLQVHVSSKHARTKQYQCKVCSERYATLHNLMQHIKRYLSDCSVERRRRRYASNKRRKSHSKKRLDDLTSSKQLLRQNSNVPDEHNEPSTSNERL